MSLTPALFLIATVGLFFGALKNPIIGILGYLTVYFVYNTTNWWSEYITRFIQRPSFIAMAFLVVGSLLHFKELNWRFSRKEKELYLFLILAWLVSLVFGVGMHPESWQCLMKLTKLFIFLLFFIRIVNSLESYRLVIWFIIITAVFLAYQSHVSGGYHGGRLDNIGGSDLDEANGLAAFMSVGMILVGFQMLRYPLWKKAILITGIAMMLDTIILTQSRAIFIGLAAAFPFVLLQALR